MIGSSDEKKTEIRLGMLTSSIPVFPQTLNCGNAGMGEVDIPSLVSVIFFITIIISNYLKIFFVFY